MVLFQLETDYMEHAVLLSIHKQRLSNEMLGFLRGVLNARHPLGTMGSNTKLMTIQFQKHLSPSFWMMSHIDQVALAQY